MHILKDWLKSPVLTVPVWPLYTSVKDSRYTVMNRDTFSKELSDFSQCRRCTPWCSPGLEIHPVNYRFTTDHLRWSQGSCRYSPVLPGLSTVMSRQLLIWPGRATVICRWHPNVITASHQSYTTLLNEDKAKFPSVTKIAFIYLFIVIY